MSVRVCGGGRSESVEASVQYTPGETRRGVIVVIDGPDGRHIETIGPWTKDEMGAIARAILDGLRTEAKP
jgi:hypothetical protein